MRKCLIGNPCVGCEKGKNCNASKYDHSACKDYVHWKFDYDNYKKLKLYGYRIVMTKRFGLGWMTTAESLRCSDEEFDSWIRALSKTDLECHRLYIQYVVEKFYKMSKQKDLNIESVINKYGF